MRICSTIHSTKHTLIPLEGDMDDRKKNGDLNETRASMDGQSYFVRKKSSVLLQGITTLVCPGESTRESQG